MTYQKGNTFGKGRPKGSKNSVQANVKSAFEKLLSNNLERLQEDLDSLSPVRRLDFILKLSEYVLPRLHRIEGNIDVNGEVFVVERKSLREVNIEYDDVVDDGSESDTLEYTSGNSTSENPNLITE